MRTSAIWWGPIWLVLVAVAVPVFGPDAATLLLAGGLVLLAAVRWLTRRRPPDGLVVRAWPIDVAVALVLAAGITVLTLR